MHGRRQFALTGDRLETLVLERDSATLGHVVPPAATVGVAEAWPRVDQHERSNAIGMVAVERKRQIPAERVATDDGSTTADGVEHGNHVADGELGRVLRGVARVVA